MKLALYLRVSTDDQSVEMQERHLNKWVKEKGHSVFSVFVDEGRSGKTLERPGFQALMKSAKYKGFDGVLVYRTDRLGRKLEDLLGVFKTFDGLGIKIFSATDQSTLDRLTPAGKLQSTVLLAASEYERDLAVERTKHGREAALAKGHYIMRPPFGYAVVEHKLEIDGDKAEIVRGLYKDRKNLSWSQLAEKYNLGRSKVRTILANPIYQTGEVRINGKIIGRIDKIIE